MLEAGLEDRRGLRGGCRTQTLTGGAGSARCEVWCGGNCDGQRQGGVTGGTSSVVSDIFCYVSVFLNHLCSCFFLNIMHNCCRI